MYYVIDTECSASRVLHTEKMSDWRHFHYVVYCFVCYNTQTPTHYRKRSPTIFFVRYGVLAPMIPCLATLVACTVCTIRYSEKLRLWCDISGMMVKLFTFAKKKIIRKFQHVSNFRLPLLLAPPGSDGYLLNMYGWVDFYFHCYWREYGYIIV